MDLAKAEAIYRANALSELRQASASATTAKVLTANLPTPAQVVTANPATTASGLAPGGSHES